MTATLATLHEPASPNNRGKRGKSRMAHSDKHGAATDSGVPTLNLVGAGVASASKVRKSRDGDQRELGDVDQSDRWAPLILRVLEERWVMGDGLVITSASLTTRDGTDATLMSAWAASRGECAAALLVPEIMTKPGHAHLHGLVLFDSDDQRARFFSRWSSVAGDLVSGGKRSCFLREPSTIASFARTGRGSVAEPGEPKSLLDDLRDVLRHAFCETRKKRGVDGSVAGEILVVGSFVDLAAAAKLLPPRFCICGCGASLAGRRKDCDAFDWTCRSKMRDRDPERTRRKKPATNPTTRAPKRGEPDAEESGDEAAKDAPRQILAGPENDFRDDHVSQRHPESKDAPEAGQGPPKIGAALMAGLKPTTTKGDHEHERATGRSSGGIGAANDPVDGTREPMARPASVAAEHEGE